MKEVKVINDEKMCSKCKQIKHVAGFSKQKDKKSGYSSQCKLCSRTSTKPIPSTGHRYCNKCGLEKPLDAFHSKGCKNSPNLKNAQCKDCVCKTSLRIIKPTKKDHKYCYSCKTEKHVSEFYKDNIKYMGISSSCKICHKHQVIKRESIRYHTDPGYKLKKLLRHRLREALNGISKSQSTLELLGCSVEKLKLHLQQTALNNGYCDFDINNYSGKEYHIDHTKPCSSFDLTKEEEQRKCFHYSNLQILTASDNMSKGVKL